MMICCEAAYNIKIVQDRRFYYEILRRIIRLKVNY